MSIIVSLISSFIYDAVKTDRAEEQFDEIFVRSLDENKIRKRCSPEVTDDGKRRALDSSPTGVIVPSQVGKLIEGVPIVTSRRLGRAFVRDH